MRVFTCTGFEGHWPVGTSAVVVANTVGHASLLLSDALKLQGLKQEITIEQLVELDTSVAAAIVLQNGEY